jgi:hypothetical protein
MCSIQSCDRVQFITNGVQNALTAVVLSPSRRDGEEICANLGYARRGGPGGGMVLLKLGRAVCR